MLKDMKGSTERHPNESSSVLLADPPAQDAKAPSKLRSLLSKLVPWGQKGGLAILDQGLISGSNFMISILLARWLMPDSYGAYAVTFGIYVALSLVYQSLVLEPMGVFGGSIYRSNLRGYLRSLVWIHVALSIAMCGGFGIAWIIAHRASGGGAMSGALAGVAIASPCLMLLALARRTFYVELTPAPATAGAFIYSALVLAGLFIVYKYALLSTFVAFLLIAIGALVTGTVLMFVLRRGLTGSGPAPAFGETWHRHWRYGRWALAACVAGWLPSYIYYPLLSAFSGMAQSGQLKALMNLTMPFEQTKGALLMLALPFAAGVAHRDGVAGARGLNRKLTVLSILAATAYWAVIIPFQKPVFHLLYSGRYMGVAYLLPALALGQIFWSATFGPQVALRALESPSTVFAAMGIATCASLVVGVPATWAYGLKGAIWGSNAADIFSFIAVYIAFERKLASGVLPGASFPSGKAKKEVPPSMSLGVPEELY